MFKVNSYSTLIIAGSLLPIVAFLVIGYLSYVNISNMLNDEAWVTHTQTVIDKTDSLLITMLDAETGARGYVITGQDKYLAPYNYALSNWNNQINELKQLTMDNPAQQSNIAKLSPLVNSKLAFLQQYVDLRKNSSLNATINFVDQGHGKEIMDNIRQVIDDMKSEEQTLLEQRTHTSEVAATNT
ncbi:MAG: CHASE3 domain-containing protein, partial [Thaumarchaeota archaeon]|nr:CHASE3 domain-containing protein [Nitrososphaerota archaeon]